MRVLSVAVLIGFVPWTLVHGQAPVPPLDVQVVATAPAIDHPLYVTSPRDDFQRIFVVQKNGYVKVRNVAGAFSTFLDVSALVSTGTEQGLLGMAFHPNYSTNGHIYVYYTDLAFNSVLARYTVSPANPDLANPATASTILTIAQPFSNHKAGCLQFGPDGYLYVAVGDGGSANDPLNKAQNTGSLLGKILRIDVDNPAAGLNYGIPPTNPFAGPGNPLDEIWALGLRNPWRFSFDRLTGDVWIADVGQDTREEIDFQPATDSTGAHGGRNYGWRCREGSLCTGLTGCSCSAPALTAPVYDYSSAPPAPETCVIGGFVYRGCAIPALRGHYFFSDRGSGKIWSLTAGPPVTVVDRTSDLDPAGPAIIPSVDSFGEDAWGELYICCIEIDTVWRIVPANPQPVGFSNFGTGTPGCAGPHALTVSCAPTLRNDGELILGTNGPPGSLGVGVVSAVPLAPGSDPFGIGVETLIGTVPGAFLFFHVPVGQNGSSAVPFPIPNAPGIVGITVYFQEFYVWPSCAPSPLGLSSTPALALTFQP